MGLILPSPLLNLKSQINIEIPIFEKQISKIQNITDDLIIELNNDIILEEKKLLELYKNEEFDTKYSLVDQDLKNKFPYLYNYEDFVQLSYHYSIIVSLYSFLEININKIYDIVKNANINIIKDKKDASQNFIFRFMKEMSASILVNLINLQQYSDKLEIFRLVRNTIVHSLGSLKQSSGMSQTQINKLKNEMVNHSILEYDNKIKFDNSDFAKSFINLINLILNYVIDELLQKFILIYNDKTQTFRRK